MIFVIDCASDVRAVMFVLAGFSVLCALATTSEVYAPRSPSHLHPLKSERFQDFRPAANSFQVLRRSIDFWGSQ
jgi:hypothetical protein